MIKFTQNQIITQPAAKYTHETHIRREGNELFGGVLDCLTGRINHSDFFSAKKWKTDPTCAKYDIKATNSAVAFVQQHLLYMMVNSQQGVISLNSKFQCGTKLLNEVF